jgi:hypothetical protein
MFLEYPYHFSLPLLNDSHYVRHASTCFFHKRKPGTRPQMGLVSFAYIPLKIQLVISNSDGFQIHIPEKTKYCDNEF